MLSNFAHLREVDPQLLRLGLLAERYFPEDPNTSLLKLRQLAELLSQQAAVRVGIAASAADSQLDLLRLLGDQGVLSREVADYFMDKRLAPVRGASEPLRIGAVSSRQAPGLAIAFQVRSHNSAELLWRNAGIGSRRLGALSDRSSRSRQAPGRAILKSAFGLTSCQ